MDGDVAHFCHKGQFLILLIKRQVVVYILRQVVTILLIAVVVARFQLSGMDWYIPIHTAMVVSISVTIWWRGRCRWRCRSRIPVVAIGGA